jgi:hypothetical protein
VHFYGKLSQKRNNYVHFDCEIMKSIQANVNGANNATFLCPHCNKPFSISVSEYKDTKHNLTLRCDCRRQFRILLNFRRYQRKNVIIVGEAMNLSHGNKAWTVITLMNLSMGGLRFKVLEPSSIQQGDKIRVRFTLDRPQEVLIDKEAIVRNKVNNEYGCEFTSFSNQKKELNLYLKNHSTQ